MAGYFSPARKFLGLIKRAYSSVPVEFLKFKISVGSRSYSSVSAWLAARYTANSAPSAERSTRLDGSVRLENVSRYELASGLIEIPCVPAPWLIRTRSLPFSPMEYNCRSSGLPSLETKYTFCLAWSTPASSVTSQFPSVSRLRSLPSSEYRYRCWNPSRSLPHRKSPLGRNRNRSLLLIQYGSASLRMACDEPDPGS